MAVIGIDLGTTNSLAAYWTDAGVEMILDEAGECMVPSVVSHVSGEGLLVGRLAKSRMVPNSSETVASFKRFMGTNKEYAIGNRVYTPMELSALVLEQIKKNAERYLGSEIEEAVITVPAYFNDKQRSDTKKAAQIAGLKVERLINEPSAAALAYRMKYGEEDKSLLIFDFGGGTLDLSYVECFDNVIEIIAVAGDNYLGGDDIDRLIAECFCKENAWDMERLEEKTVALLLKRAEAVKRKITPDGEVALTLPVAGANEVVLNEDKLFEICMPLFTKIKNLFLHILEDAGVRVSDIDDLIMVGGSSNLSVVKRFLTDMLGKEPVVLGDTDKVVAMGAGVYAGIRSRNEEVRDLLLTDVCPFTLGVESFHKKGESKGYLLPLIERNSTLPAMKKQRLYTLNDYQKAITLKIYQGEEYFAKDNIFLGEITSNVIPKRAGEEWVDVYFTYDINGILHVRVVNARDEKKEILLANQVLGKAELERCQKEMQKLICPPIEQEANIVLIKRAEEYYEQSTGVKREFIGSLIDWFVTALNSGRIHVVRKAVEEMKRQLACLEIVDSMREEMLFDGELKINMESDWEDGEDTFDEE